MARVILVDGDKRPDLAQLVAKLSGARGGKLINVYRLLLNTPPIASAWVDFNSAVRKAFELDQKTLEIVIIRVAILNRTEYIFRAHVPGYATKAGLTTVQVDDLFDWQTSTAFDAKERATLAYTDEVTRNVQASDAVFSEASVHYSEQQMVELTVLIGAYNMHSRVMSALKSDFEPGWDLSAVQWKPAK
ncbi:MAG: carboxymuconolactone decarboxylase family protein [Burkholderiales bacterium]|nr:carboxymuconolactone decarboxylase family protein [Burkholderiales bacterium]